MKETSTLQMEIADIKKQLNKIDMRLDKLFAIVERIASRGSTSQLETLSTIPLDTFNGKRNSDTFHKILPSWSSRTLAAVRKLCRKGVPPTAASVANITGKRRNTESARLVLLASLGLVQRKRNGRNVLYLYGG
jgi:hypothetical protein